MMEEHEKRFGCGGLSLAATSEDMALLKQMNEAKFLLSVINKSTDRKVPSNSRGDKNEKLETLKSEYSDDEEYPGEMNNLKSS